MRAQLTRTDMSRFSKPGKSGDRLQRRKPAKIVEPKGPQQKLSTTAKRALVEEGLAHASTLRLGSCAKEHRRGRHETTRVHYLFGSGVASWSLRAHARKAAVPRDRVSQCPARPIRHIQTTRGCVPPWPEKEGYIRRNVHIEYRPASLRLLRHGRHELPHHLTQQSAPAYVAPTSDGIKRLKLLLREARHDVRAPGTVHDHV